MLELYIYIYILRVTGYDFEDKNVILSLKIVLS